MLDFHPITAEAIPQIAPYLGEYGERLCDFSPVNLYIWRSFFYDAYAIEDDMLFLRLKADDNAIAYAVPMGAGDRKAAFRRLYRDTKERGEALCLSLVPEESLSLIAEAFGVTPPAHSEREWDDYLYAAAPMAAYEGRAYAKQRNHLRKFDKLYPSARVELLEERHMPALRVFLNAFLEQRHKHGVLAEEEIDRAYEALKNRDLLGLFGIVLYDGDRLIGFSAGATVGDTLFVHFEKALTTYDGIYQKLVKEFASRFVTPSIAYINREEDCGDEGLRKSKLAYHPIRLLSKYTLTIE